MKLLQGLKNKLQVLNLRKELKTAQASTATEDNWQEIGRRGIDGISSYGKFLGNSRDAKCTMRFALAGIKEAGAEPSMNATAGIPDPKQDFWLQMKEGKEFAGMNMGDGQKAVMAAYGELSAAMARPPVKSSPDPAPSAEVKPAPPTQSPSAAVKPPMVAQKPVPAPALPKPAASKSPFATKPSFDQLKGVERVSVSMKWEADRKQWYNTEAERQIAAEEAAAKPAGPASAPTAENIAKAILDEQAERAKPKASAWTREAGDRKKKVEARAKELMSKDSQ